MTNEEAIKWFRNSPVYHKDHEPYNKAIKALEQQPCDDAVSRQAVLDIINERECHEEYCGNHCEGKCSSVCITIALANKVADLPSVTPIRPKGYISIDDVMSVFDDFMCGEVDEDGTDTFLEMLKDRAESEE